MSENIEKSNINLKAAEDNRFYQLSGKFNPLIILGIPVMGLAVALLAIIYAYIIVYNPLIYFNVLLFLGYCFTLGLLTVGLNKLFKTRNTTITLFFSLLTSLTALYFFWGTFMGVLFPKMGDQEISIVELLYSPGILWELICKIAENGWYSVFGGTPSGMVLWIFWGIEALGLVGTPVVFGLGFSTTTVFCEKCNAWANEENAVLVFTHSHFEELQGEFLEQNLNFLGTSSPATIIDPLYYQIDAEWCKNCEQLLTLSLRRVSKTWDEKGEESESTDTIFEDMLVSKETFNKVMEAKKTFGKMVMPPETSEEEPNEEKESTNSKGS